MKRISPACFLFFFAVITAEYLSGSTPLGNPILLVANLFLYGPGALLIRELKCRWHKGWLAVFLLSIAYVVAEEGLMLNTLFDPTRNTSGRALGVNWVWSVGMLIVHSLVSLFLPIYMAETIYPKRIKERWIQPKTFYLLLAAFWLNVLGLGSLMIKENRPGSVYYVIEFALIVGAVIAARLIDLLPLEKPSVVRSRSPRRMFFTSFAGTCLVFAAGFAAPGLKIPAWEKVILLAGVYFAFLWCLRQHAVFDPDLSPHVKLAVGSGIISFWIGLSPLMSYAKHSPVPLLVGTLMVVFLYTMHKRLREQLLPLTK